MNKELLIQHLLEGKSTRDIEKITGKHRNTISYWIKKYDLTNSMKYKKNGNFLLGKVDGAEKAYTLGFVLADGSINYKKDVEITVNIRDKEIVEFISDVINSNVTYDRTFDKKARRFPRARTQKRIKDISKYIGGDKKNDRHFPRIPKHLERYLLLGIFDADGCITWGKRKDRNRLWHKISFTSQYKILEGVQQILLKRINIASSIKPKSNENCYVLEFSNRENIVEFLNYIYQDDFVVLKRKHIKWKALRLELGENGES